MLTSSKAVSPLVATVLLIGLVISIAGIIFVWIHGFAILATEVAEEEMEPVIECTYGRIALLDLRYCEPWLGGVFYNRGTIDLYDLRFQILYANLSMERIAVCDVAGTGVRCDVNVTANLTIGPREQIPFNVSIGGSNYEMVRLLTVCEAVFDEEEAAEIAVC
jgi:hypothetical protein